MQRFIAVFIFLIFAQAHYGQKKKINALSYDEWNHIKNEQISDNGTRITFEINPIAGDGALYISSGSDSNVNRIPRGKSAQISSDGNTVIFKISQPYDSIRALKIKKVKKAKFPKDSAAIWHNGMDTLLRFDKVDSYSIAEEKSSWTAIVFDDDDRFKLVEKKKKKCFLRRKKPEPPTITEKGKATLFINPATGQRLTTEKADEYAMSRFGNKIAYIRNRVISDSLDSASVYLYYTRLDSTVRVFHREGSAKNLFFDEAEKSLGFMASADTGENKNHTLYIFDNERITQPIQSDWLEEGWGINDAHEPYFSKSGERLFLYTSPLKKNESKDTIPADEKAQLDVWNYKDGRLQPQQLLSVKRDRNKGYLAVWNRVENKFSQIGSETLDFEGFSQMDGDGDFCLGSTQLPYERLMSWEGWFSDYYRISVATGEQKLLAKKVQYRPYFSPEGMWFAYFSQADTTWHAVNCETLEDKSITAGIPTRFDNEDDDHPMAPNPYGIAGWTKGGDIIVYDKFNAWRINLKDEFPPQNLTRTRSSGWEYRYWKQDPEAHYIDLKDVTFWEGFNHTTKAMAIAELGRQSIRNIYRADAQMTSLIKAKKSDEVIFRTQRFETYPDLKVTTTGFTEVTPISEANPQQSDYNWGTVELISWKSFKGLELEGLLYKPENFDPEKQYPLMVYFYEKNSHNLHRHFTPRPTASIIYPSEYASNGYLVFIPDIKYTDGHPAKSAYDCIVSGTDFLTKKFSWVDSSKMALQGQSWGGYQTAMLITMTNKYKCAMAGAPVSNMTSAYGGIRWGSGLSRMFQYEQTQTRLGGNLWDSLDVYIENSPIFYVPKIETPVLIMHNDNDGAVPWYQGIEYFVSLRRLNKPAWLLNYNGDQHNLRKKANVRDLSIRMRQFFDHYLLDKPQPKWMTEGIPALEKGKNYGLKLEE